MLADDRETLHLAKHGVNAVNIEQESLDFDFLDISFQINEISQEMIELGLQDDKEIRDLLDLLKIHGYSAKKLWERVVKAKKNEK